MSNITRQMIQKAMMEDLKESGITTRHQITKLKFKPLTSAETESITKIHLPSYSIPYFDTNGKALPFRRIKFLAPVPGSPGQKYWQKAETLPHAYLPPFLSKLGGWKSIIQDISVPIYITEGEKKSACACINDIPCIGLGGVWSFKSKKAGQPLIQELSKIKWKGRKVYIIFDNDIMMKPDVLRALETLSSTLRNRGVASIFSVYLETDDPDEKLGLDDFIVQYGVKALTTKTHEETNDLLTKLNEMNTRYSVASNHGEKIFCFKTHKFLSPQGFINVTEAPNKADIIDENNKPKRVKVAKEWLEWPNRRKIHDLVFQPGEDRITKDNNFNLWEGFPYLPKKGDTKLFLELIDHVFKDVPKEIKLWFMQWIAYPLQKPGTKMHSAVLVWGDQGSGKTFIGQIIKNLYGSHGKFVEQLSFNRDFNEWAVNTQFAAADEVIFHGDRRESNVLKNIITREEVTINQKYQPSYTVKDYTNYYFTSNHPDAIYLERDDRRFLIVETRGKKPQSFYTRLDRLLRTPEAYSAIMYYLLNNVNIKKFDPKSEAPVTLQKEDMIHETMSSLDQILEQLIRSPSEFLQVGGTTIKRDVFTASEIKALLPMDFKNTSLNAVGRSLRRAGCAKRAVNVKSANGQWAFRRLYAVRNVPKWKQASGDQIAAEYIKESMIFKDNILPFKKKRKKKFTSSK